MRHLAALALAFGLSAPTLAQEPSIAAFEVTLVGREVRGSLQLENALDAELLERIQSGLPTGFIYRFQLYRDHKRWFDNSLDRVNLEVVAMYNAVTQEYLVNTKSNERLISSQVVRSAADLEAAMTRLADVPLFTLAPEIPRSWRLLLRARAELGTTTKFLFVPTTIGTSWVRSRKFRAPASPSP